MKSLIFAAALMLGGAAVAQDTTGTTTDTMTTTAATGTVQAPSNAAPKRDARGIPVVSAEAAAPAGYNQPAQVGPAGTLTPVAPVTSMGAAGDLPPCTRKVTDHCVQTYERGHPHG
ncbi:MAG TPA: hypothetical protein VGD66_07985 [Allosphingosinicella sp.]|jgi:hypothetical protein